MRVVIVGAGIAGVRTAEALRDKGFDGDIVLIGDETEAPYDRPPLSKQVLRGEREPFFLMPASLEVDLRLGVAALGLEGRTLRTSAGELGFDELVIATGAHPRRLPGAPGMVLRTLEDSRRLGALLSPGVRLGIVGAGLIGCEVAASARLLGAEVQVVDVLPLPLVRLLGPVVARRVLDLHMGRGVQFHLGVGVAAASASSLLLTDGTDLDVDVVLEAMGVTPTVTWLERSGLDVADGVQCDAVGRAADGVWALGDVARWGEVRQEHWTSASEQGDLVAAGILGDPVPVISVPYWWSDQYDVKLQGLGSPSAEDDVVVRDVGPRQRPLAVYSRDGLVTGAVGFSAAAAVMGLREAISSRQPLDEVLAALT